MKQLSEKTLLPLSLILTIVSAVFWFGSSQAKIETRLEKNEETVKELKDSCKSDIREIKEDIKLLLQRRWK